MPENLLRYLILQSLEIEEHKYYLSQKQGRDVGYEEAIRDWTSNGHAQRWRQAYDSHPQVERECDSYCGPGNCKGKITTAGIKNCPMQKKRLHELVED